VQNIKNAEDPVVLKTPGKVEITQSISEEVPAIQKPEDWA